MALPIPTGELLGQQITINCTEQEDDFYLGQSIADLSTEYDFTKGVDITFDGQLYKNVPIEFISDEGAFMIGEAGGHSPLFDKYPFFILLGLDTPLEISIHIAVLDLYVKTQGEHTFVVTEVSSSERVMKLSGASRTYSHTAEPRFVKKANKTNELPEITSADAGKVLGVTEDGKIAPVEGGGGVPVKIIHISSLADDIVEEDYDTIISYFTDYDEGKCVIMVDVGGEGYTPLVFNGDGLGGFWFGINPDTGAMLVQSFMFTIDTEEKTVTLSHYGVIYTGTLEGTNNYDNQ